MKTAQEKPVKARIQVESVCIICPRCNEIVEEQVSGSQFFTEDEFTKLEKTFDCGNCGTKLSRPRSPFRK